MTITTFTPIVPTLNAGPNVTPGVEPLDPEELTFTAVGQTGDLVPISTTRLTMVFVKNTSAGTPTITLDSQLDPWGADSCHDLVITMSAGNVTPNIKLVGVLLPYRWKNTAGYCTLTYSATSGVSVAVVHVPYTSN